MIPIHERLKTEGLRVTSEDLRHYANLFPDKPILDQMIMDCDEIIPAGVFKEVFYLVHTPIILCNLISKSDVVISPKELPEYLTNVQLAEAKMLIDHMNEDIDFDDLECMRGEDIRPDVFEWLCCWVCEHAIH